MDRSPRAGRRKRWDGAEQGKGGFDTCRGKRTRDRHRELL
ncbi:hypothetical protein AKJ09_06020 [Labilithrix luteola]|uniref:Uncharacterized protein n=1 Tax=Labilithrix luteola TaxID=1391654 RepID=A0A0K1Q149_9BACT|nr:hypothetical protein AKJ09_06020 [Labilithrix luteola]